MAVKYKIINDFGTIENKKNAHIALRMVKWFDKDPSLDLRVWFKGVDEETPSKGFTFSTQEGPHNLTEKMVELGYGDTQKLKGMLDDREKNPVIPPTELGIPEEEMEGLYLNDGKEYLENKDEEDDDEEGYISSKDILNF